MSSENRKEIFESLGGLALMILFLGSMFFAGLVITNYYNCKTYQADSTVETVSTLTKCYVKTDLGLIELDRYQLELIYRNMK